MSAPARLVAAPLFYVMPFIEGETLRSKLDRETEPYVRNGGDLGYDGGLDGKRFLMTRPVGANRANADQLILVENLFGELKAKVKQ